MPQHPKYMEPQIWKKETNVFVALHLYLHTLSCFTGTIFDINLKWKLLRDYQHTVWYQWLYLNTFLQVFPQVGLHSEIQWRKPWEGRKRVKLIHNLLREILSPNCILLIYFFILLHFLKHIAWKKKLTVKKSIIKDMFLIEIWQWKLKQTNNLFEPSTGEARRQWAANSFPLFIFSRSNCFSQWSVTFKKILNNMYSDQKYSVGGGNMGFGLNCLN